MTQLIRIRAGVLLVAMIAVAVPWVASADAQPTEPALLEQVRAAWTRRQEAIRTLRVSWDCKQTTPKGVMTDFFPRLDKSGPAPIIPPSDAVDDITGELLLDGDKARITTRQPLWDGTTNEFIITQFDSTFDGLIHSNIMLRDSKFPQLVIKKDTQNRDGSNIPVSVLLDAVRGLKDNLVARKFDDYTQARSTTGGSRTLVELTRPRNETRGEGKIWVDPAADFSIVRVEDYDRDGKLSFKTIVVPSRVSPGVWLPERWTCAMLQVNGKLFRQVEATARNREVNVETSAADFQLRPPPGTRVYDATGTEPRNYITRENKPDREILRSELFNTYEDLARTETGDLAPKSPASPWRWVMIAAGAVITIGSSGLIARWHRRRERSRSTPPM